MQITVISLLFIGFSILPLNSFGRTLNESEILRRCYTHLTGQRLPSTDPLLSQLKTGQSAIDLCIGLLDKVHLTDTGPLSESTNVLHRRVLKQFHDFHRSWFRAQSMKAAGLLDAVWGTLDVYDPAEASLFITRSLFREGTPYSSIFSGNLGMEALRDSSKITDPGTTGRFPRVSRTFYNNAPGDTYAAVLDSSNFNYDNADGTFGTVPVGLIQVGELYGIRPRTEASTSPMIWTDIYTANPKAPPASGIIAPQNIYQHFGGGALGTQSYMLLNFGHPFTYISNGSTKLPRKWVASAFEEFLCLKLPYVRVSDVASYVKSAGGNVAPFRTQTSCLQCHAGMDQTALVTRNLRLGVTGSQHEVTLYHRNIATISSYPVSASVSAGQDPWPAEPIDNFHQQTPQGKVFFRSINGQLVNQSISSVGDFGSVLSQSDDPYTCAASRYFEYVTGIQIGVFDIYDPTNAELVGAMTDLDREYRNYVLDLGKELKVTGSLKTLLRRIIRSPYYKLSNYGRKQ